MSYWCNWGNQDTRVQVNSTPQRTGMLETMTMCPASVR